MLNRAILIGRFTRDPELRSTPQGINTCSFTLAVDRNYVKPGAEKQADFITCVAWRQTAEFISKYFRKGNLVAVEGSIQTRSWDDNEGKRRYATDVVISQAYFVESKKEAAAVSSTSAESLPSPYGDLPEPIAPLGTDDDLPF